MKIIVSENQKREIAQGATLLFMFMFVGFLAITKYKKPDIQVPALTSSIVNLNNFNYDCLDIWLLTKNDVKEVIVNSCVVRVKSVTFDNTRAIQIIKSNDPKQVGEEIIFIETLNGWQRENGPATKEDIEMMSELRKKLK